MDKGPAVDCEKHAEQMVEIRESLAAIHAKLDRMERVEKAVFGNGTPGLTTRVDRAEQALSRFASAAKWLAGLAMLTLASGIAWFAVRFLELYAKAN